MDQQEDVLKQLTTLKAIRAKCLDCSCDQPYEVRLCPCIKRALWPFRLGRNPKAGSGKAAAMSHSTGEALQTEAAKSGISTVTVKNEPI